MSEENNEEIFELDPEDAAIIMKKDLSFEIILPKMEDDTIIDSDEHKNILAMMALGSLFKEPEFTKQINERIATMLAAMEAMEDEDSPCGGCPGGGDCNCG